MAWLDALKQWNATQPKWTIPKKGSKEYDEVMAIHKGTKKGGMRRAAQAAKKPMMTPEEVDRELARIDAERKAAAKKAADERAKAAKRLDDARKAAAEIAEQARRKADAAVVARTLPPLKLTRGSPIASKAGSPSPTAPKASASKPSGIASLLERIQRADTTAAEARMRALQEQSAREEQAMKEARIKREEERRRGLMATPEGRLEVRREEMTKKMGPAEYARRRALAEEWHSYGAHEGVPEGEVVGQNFEPGFKVPVPNFSIETPRPIRSHTPWMSSPDAATTPGTRGVLATLDETKVLDTMGRFPSPDYKPPHPLVEYGKPLSDADMRIYSKYNDDIDMFGAIRSTIPEDSQLYKPGTTRYDPNKIAEVYKEYERVLDFYKYRDPDQYARLQVPHNVNLMQSRNPREDFRQARDVLDTKIRAVEGILENRGLPKPERYFMGDPYGHGRKRRKHRK